MSQMNSSKITEDYSMRKLPTVSEMEHITSKEFGENMDAILERVAKEDVALIIDHADKSYVCVLPDGLKAQS